MRSKYSFEIMDLDDGLVAVPIGDGADQFHGVLKVNETAVSILKLLEQDTSEEKIVDALMQEYSGDKAQITNYVHAFVKKLIDEGVVALP